MRRENKKINAKGNLKRALAFGLSLAMAVGSPFTSFAGNSGESSGLIDEKGTFVSETHDVFSRTTSTLAPGVTQDLVFAYNKDNSQMAYYVMTADITDPQVSVYANYTRNQCLEYGMEKLTTQLAQAQAKHSNPEDPDNYIENYNVIGGVNADFYNMTTGRPSGAFVMEGVVANGANNKPWFAILDDGTAAIGYNNSDWALVADRVQEAVGGSQVLVWKGEDVTANASGAYNTDRHSRTCVGITAEGKVVLMVLDGRQEPFSAGGTMHELAQIMLEAGCVSAINLDGGGSTTFAAKQEGENDIKVINRPSDGSERSVSSSLMVVSTAVPSDKFDHAIVTADKEYVTPASQVTVSAKAVSASGSEATLPEDYSWQLADASFGTMDGASFTSNGKTGNAVIQMVYEGKVVGETTVHVVIPDKLAFEQDEVTIPYGKSAELEITATYGLNEVTIKADDFDFEVENSAAGSLNGFAFVANNDETVTGTKVTAKLKYNETVISTNIVLGKGSEVIFDFETANANLFYGGYGKYNYVVPETSVYNVDSATGKVHTGNGALAFDVNYGNSLESGYMMSALAYLGETQVFEGAKRIGLWMYIPDEAVGSWIRWVIPAISGYKEDGSPITTTLTGQELDGTSTSTTGFVSSFEESGWHYISIDVSKYKGLALNYNSFFMQFYVSDRDGSSFGYNHNDYKSFTGQYVFYIDDVTVDYSSAVDDREAPIFSNLTYADQTMSDAVELKGQTISNNVVSFSASLRENTKKNNYTGLDLSTIKAYVDGNEVACKYNNGLVSIEDVKLLDGLHKIKFSACDKMGNYASIIREINIAAGNVAGTVKIVAQDPSLDKIPLGSVYYVDVLATNVDTLKSVTMDLERNNMSVWELDHMDVAEGFEAEYSIVADERIATITITRVGNTPLTGEAVIASLPIRTWELKTGYVYTSGTMTGKQAYTYEDFKKMKEFWAIDISVEVDRGLITYTDNTSAAFSGQTVQVDTEMWAEDAYMLAQNKGYYENWNGGHTHTVVAAEDKAAGCTTKGYTGRTVCSECGSVVDWGTTIDATGHNFEIVDGIKKCSSCGDLFNGVDEDGRSYVDGLLVEDGWHGNAYYKDGFKYTGVKAVDGIYYDFGIDGNSKGKYTGVFYDDAVAAYRYAQVGELSSGWKMIDSDWYYFIPDTFVAASGEYSYNKITYVFEENGRLTTGVWKEVRGKLFYYYGPKYYSHCWATIDGKKYYFGNDGEVYTGVKGVRESYDFYYKWFDFGEDGAVVSAIEGPTVINHNGTYYYVCDGISGENGLVYYDGKYYYTKKFGVLATGTITVTDTNNLLPRGNYTFGEDGALVPGFVKDKNGIRYFDGKDFVTGWVETASERYFLDENGYLVTSELFLDGNLYRFAETGELTETVENYSGFVLNAGKKYYVENGEIVTGWKTIAENTYCFDKTGAALTGKRTISGIAYTFDSEGVLTAGVFAKSSKGIRYYYAGDYCVGWKVIDEESYYFDPENGYAYVGTREVNGEYYEFDTNGILIKKLGNLYSGFVNTNGKTFYYENNEKVTGWKTIDKDVYYFSTSTGEMYCKKYRIDGIYYTFGSDGKLQSGTWSVKAAGTRYFYAGEYLTGWQVIDGKQYCFSADGYMYTGQSTIDGVFYEFDENGVFIKKIEAESYTGFITNNGKTVYYEDNQIVYGWKLIDGYYYYFSLDTGAMYTGRRTISGLKYEFAKDGKTSGYAWKNTSKGKRLYLAGESVIGLEEVDGELYFFNEKGYLVVGSIVVVEETTYIADEDGKLAKVTQQGEAGINSNITWVIDENGTLTITGQDTLAAPVADEAGSISEEAIVAVRPWLQFADAIKSVTVKGTEIKDLSYFFAGCKNLEKIDFSKADLEKVENVTDMFKNCDALKEVILPEVVAEIVTAAVTALEI